MNKTNKQTHGYSMRLGKHASRNDSFGHLGDVHHLARRIATRAARQGVTAAIVVGLLGTLGIQTVAAKGGNSGSGGGDGGNAIGSLKTAPVPRPANLSQFVSNEAAAIQLGKALFWDMQVGSDGKTACATCHFQAGADIRTRNQINPHGNGLFDSARSANEELLASRFPVLTDDVVGSAGVVKRTFMRVSTPATSDWPVDYGVAESDPVFNIDGINIRQVTGRNAPSVINAVYNFRNFWDGRARETFNGVNPHGAADPEARVLRVEANGTINKVQISIDHASLASQAVGPANSSVEMAWAGRSFPDIGKKLLNSMTTPLVQQAVHVQDSQLGTLVNLNGRGLRTSYAALVQRAFQPQWWNSTKCVDNTLTEVTRVTGCPSSYSVMEANFSLFWGLSVMLYESTLRADDTPFDRNALTAQQQRGLGVFTGKGKCTECHSGAELTKAAQAGFDAETGLPAGFFNTGVRPVAEDAGLGNGAFKTPHLRNIELNAPYFHNGSAATLRQVVEFYDRGGDNPGEFTHGKIRPLHLTEEQKTDLVAFMLALTDARVKNESAPFDHPSLQVSNGHSRDGADELAELPAVGARGRTAQGLAPLQPFLAIDPFRR
jgi:cytochrome c peroxidase